MKKKKYKWGAPAHNRNNKGGGAATQNEKIQKSLCIYSSDSTSSNINQKSAKI